MAACVLPLLTDIVDEVNKLSPCDGAVFRKADLRELKRLHVQENRLMQALASKALTAKEEQMKKFEIDKQVSAYIHKTYVHILCLTDIHF